MAATSLNIDDAAGSPIFHPADAEILARTGHLKPADGRRSEVSSRLMFEGYFSSSSGSKDWYIVPDLLVSPETLIYFGWGHQKAEEIWTRWRELIYMTEFLDFVLEEYVPEVHMSDGREACIQQMEHLGLADELINCIMASEFEDIRMTETVQYWVRDTMSVRYLGLEGLQKNSARRNEKRRSGVQDVGVVLDY
ncbi:uncharacterized protein EAF02_005422 [Botrytis sinoallii]|uniref:uncharacterized protein n=1 Tax=Botrytis sinoallii TaxID=1463999 RepID=UPI0019023795|nr:uncharacterized protein EAF02_005422 [Botrytis sinoallii]KAF7883502.1 hypothetical protein EAF02_005422 [Botrytis sinoallii]